MKFDRRSFIRCASLLAAGNAAGMRPFSAINSLAESTSGYKALVCIFLYGGNDSNNTLVPFNTTANGSNGHAAYRSIRGPLALPLNDLLALGAGADGNYGVHPNLPDIPGLFNEG